jgi:hypothetical protein
MTSVLASERWQGYDHSPESREATVNPESATRDAPYKLYMPPIRALYAGPVIEYHNHGLFTPIAAAHA